jgi:Protein of unknown function (DUF732)
MFKKTLAAALIGGAITAGAIAGTGTAAASSDSFLNTINANGWYESTPGYLLNLGYGACAVIGQGYGEAAAVNAVYNRTDNTVGWGRAAWFVQTAENHLCR